MNRRLTHIMLLGAAFLVTASVAQWAQQAAAAEAPEQETESTEETTSSSDRPPSGSEARKANDKGGIFRPTEDISEDISVSFPVDI